MVLISVDATKDGARPSPIYKRRRSECGVLIYLDTNIVIYAVENPAVFCGHAKARLQHVKVQGSRSPYDGDWEDWAAREHASLG
jgi:hypothetical protein